MESNLILTFIVFGEILLAFGIIAHALWVTRNRQDHKSQQKNG